MKNLIVICLLVLNLSVFAQDKIVKKTGETIECEVSEIGADEIKYFYKDKPALIFGIDKALVDKVQFATGELIVVESNTFKNAEYYANQNTRALKINFLSPIMGSTEFAYEQNINPGNSWETALGIIGLGVDVADINPIGLYTKFAYKFSRTPDFYTHRMHYSHIMKGAYFAPEIGLRYMEFDAYNYDYYYGSSSETNRESEFALALTLKFGKQWVFNDAFLVDLYFGAGYGFSNNIEQGPYPYGFIAGNEELPIALTAGLRIGWVF